MTKAKDAAHGRATKSVLAASLVILALLYLRVIFLPVATTINLVPDDALFYFQVAKNFAYFGKITFDGIEPATGFHPGWMFLIFSVYKPLTLFVKFEPEIFYRITLGFSLFFIFISMILGLNFLRSRSDTPSFILPVLVAMLGLKFIWNVGLETEALIALFACHLIFKSRGDFFIAAIFAALVTFFRIDMVGLFFMLAIFGLIFKARQEKGGKTISFLPDFAGSIVGFGFAMFFYLAVSGHPFSTSMYLKGGLFDVALASIKRNFSLFERFDLYVALASAFMFFLTPRGERKRLSPLCIYILSLFVWLLFHVFFNRLCAPWYFKPFRYFLTLFFFAAASILWERRKALAAIVMILPILFGLKWVYMAAVGKYDGGETQVYEFSKQIKGTTPEPVFARDYSGIIAFFSGKRVVNGDGLMNTREFIQDYLLAGLVNEYVRERQIPSCAFSYPLSAYKKFKEQGAILEEGCPFFLKCLPDGFKISTERIILEDCNSRWEKCLALVDCRGL